MKAYTLTELKTWKKLKKHFKNIKQFQIKSLFEKDPDRFYKFSINWGPILFDYSKNLVTEETISLLYDLAEEIKIKEKVKMMFEGEKINVTEKRRVLHTALRNISSRPLIVDGVDIAEKVNQELDKIKRFAEDVREGRWRGITGEKIKYIVNIGIGGSCIGPKMIVHALSHTNKKDIKAYFMSNIDPIHVISIIKKIEPEKTIFIISSKSFTTQETMINAHFVREWFLSKIKNEKAISKHFVAVSTNLNAVEKFGIPKENTFCFWDWVGGRFSLWSSIGLSIAIFLGEKKFTDLLKGAGIIDEYFLNFPLYKNIPIIMALLSIWYTNFFNALVHMVVPYSEALKEFPAYLQQLEMESNGKSVTLEGKKTNYNTGYVITGGVGTDAQHSFFQLLHQGTITIPCDFIIFANDILGMTHHHKFLLANCFAQSKALVEGNKHLKENWPIYKIIEGNKPSNTFLVQELSAYSLGCLIALYEHKIFVEGLIWNINSFDQWGVELGKTLAKDILNKMNNNKSIIKDLDSSTKGLIEYYQKWTKSKSLN